MVKNDSSFPSAQTTALSQQCAGKILQIIPEITHFLRDEVRQYGESATPKSNSGTDAVRQPRLSLSQLRILYFLDRHPESSLSEVAQNLDVTRPTMSEAIERLVQNGLVLRVNDPQQRRQILLSLTSAGSKYQQQVYQALLACIEQKLNSLSDQQNSQIIEALLLLEGIISSETDSGDRAKNP
ncbi:MAG: MarR family winged helix-turn-helix transcriptional regulator [Pleurocapsa sp.]